MMWTGPNDAPLSSKEERMDQMYNYLSIRGSLPEIVGHIVIAKDIRLGVYKRPHWFHMLMMRLFFGWEYQPVQD